MPLMSIRWRVSSCNGCRGSKKLAMTEKSWEKCNLYTRNETDKGQNSRLTAFRGNLAYDSSPMKVPIIRFLKSRCTIQEISSSPKASFYDK
jgi:hypothetical protein